MGSFSVDDALGQIRMGHFVRLLNEPGEGGQTPWDLTITAVNSVVDAMVSVFMGEDAIPSRGNAATIAGLVFGTAVNDLLEGVNWPRNQDDLSQLHE